MRKNLLILLSFCTVQALAASSCTPKALAVRPKLPQDTLSFSDTVFRNGEGGYASYRIPAIIRAPDGSLLAFIEGRVNSAADFGDVKILVKRSSDNGRTWGPALLVAQNGNLQAGNPAPVVDNTDPDYPGGRIFLFYCTGNNTQANVTHLQGVREAWYITSKDNGLTWSTPVNITLQVHHPWQPAFNPLYTDTLKWTAYATTPGHALQISHGQHSGRIVVPVNHGIYSSKTNYAAVFYTDDHGKTFHLSPDVPLQSDETTAAELPGGGILLNSRDQYLGRHERILSYDSTGSLDGTAPWRCTSNPYLPDPVCEGSMINYINTRGEQVLLFSNPVSPAYTRTQLGVRQSFDLGETWTSPVILDGGDAAYSDLVIQPDGHIGVLYEAGDYSVIRFISIKYNQIPVQ